MSGWKPIATAPKDGAIFDCWVHRVGNRQGYRLPDCNFVIKNYGNDAWKGEPVLCHEHNRALTVDNLVATHWQPLPEPPGDA